MSKNQRHVTNNNIQKSYAKLSKLNKFVPIKTRKTATNNLYYITLHYTAPNQYISMWFHVRKYSVGASGGVFSSNMGQHKTH